MSTHRKLQKKLKWRLQSLVWTLFSHAMFPWLPIALETARLPLTRHVPMYRTTPPRASIRLFSSWKISCLYCFLNMKTGTVCYTFKVSFESITSNIIYQIEYQSQTEMKFICIHINSSKINFTFESHEFSKRVNLSLTNLIFW